MDPAKDVDGSHVGSEAAVHEQYAAVDDAADVWLFHHDLPKRRGPVLGSVEYPGHNNAVFRYRLGLHEL